MNYFQMVIEFEVPDDSMLYHSIIDCNALKNYINEKLSESSGLIDIQFISTIKPSAKVRFDRMKAREEEK